VRQQEGRQDGADPPPGAAVLRPARVADATADRVAVASSDGHLLVFPVSELPAMERGKGNKLIALPAGKRGQPRPAAVAIGLRAPRRQPRDLFRQAHPDAQPADVERYTAEARRRGAALPRGFQRVDALGLGS